MTWEPYWTATVCVLLLLAFLPHLLSTPKALSGSKLENLKIVGWKSIVAAEAVGSGCLFILEAIQHTLGLDEQLPDVSTAIQPHVLQTKVPAALLRN